MRQREEIQARKTMYANYLASAAQQQYVAATQPYMPVHMVMPTFSMVPRPVSAERIVPAAPVPRLRTDDSDDDRFHETPLSPSRKLRDIFASDIQD